MCVTDILSSDDLYHLPPGDQFCIITPDDEWVATKIIGYNSYCEVDVPALGEEGEGLEMFYDEISDDGETFINDDHVKLRRKTND